MSFTRLDEAHAVNVIADALLGSPLDESVVRGALQCLVASAHQKLGAGWRPGDERLTLHPLALRQGGAA
jgi:hypothetical protein